MVTSKPSLLLVDDDAVYRTRLAKAIAARGYDVLSAEKAEAALALARGQKVELAVLDLRMPGESGLELLRQLRALHPEVRVVMLTGYGSIATVMEAVHLGAVNYLTKPADVDDLLSAFFPEGQAKAPIPPAVTPSLARVAWEHLHRLMQDCEGNPAKAAQRLGLNRRAMDRRVVHWRSGR